MVVVGAAWALLTWAAPTDQVIDPPSDLPIEVAPPSLPRSFEPWPPFVLTWQVDGAVARSGPAASLGSSLGLDPCRAVDASPCFVRLAWHDLRRWSLTASPDAVFDEADPRQLTARQLHYEVEAGVVAAVIDSDRLPPLHLCQVLLNSLWDGENVRGDLVDGASGAEIYLRVPGGASARCLKASGIPVNISRFGVDWEMTGLELRDPTDDEIGLGLVIGAGEVAQGAVCDSGAHGWLLSMAARAGYGAEPVGSGVRFQVPDGMRWRPVVSWLTSDQPELVPAGARRRRLISGLVVEETLEPALVVSVAVDDVRLWLAFDDPPDSRRPHLEHGSFVLGEVIRRLVDAVAGPPETVCSPAATH